MKRAALFCPLVVYTCFLLAARARTDLEVRRWDTMPAVEAEGFPPSSPGEGESALTSR
jgi:hypothetical protein